MKKLVIHRIVRYSSFDPVSPVRYPRYLTVPVQPFIWDISPRVGILSLRRRPWEKKL
jgi:hypothetical protein